ncbi:MAG: hypothetical protein AAFP28_08450 [Pseudomonadota bacterium]
MANRRSDTDGKHAVFLERRGYRRRRLADAARVVPVVGGVLILMPLFWSQADGERVSTVSAFLYVFGVWALMIAAAAIMSWLLSRKEED